MTPTFIKLSCGWWCEYPINYRQNRTKMVVGLAGLFTALYFTSKAFEVTIVQNSTQLFDYFLFTNQIKLKQ
ncbi:hypothetical protein PPL_10127 [Heterostelium album PN500]|uniref:Uncharacterized protein n=1 Tax=Heterostelium pallidum (strain ATCC 26659 / Pp 5 / PN500) TaxID=670386 RepID=D3BQE2_HETP5|nr:hypothetical protein PPL_10127 [Heterostelium album PN500]EFA76362.1 hypothetical protein PPL_10127 [Heterostelium album PN500]|eukprot:XP_020428494.1 hypothetical protein PPL_10127 [Heterostelium album PN500]